MMENKNKTQEEQLEKEIKFILQLFNSNKLKSAEKEIQKQLKKHPNSFVLFNILGAVLAAKNFFTDAIKNYKKSIKINPNYAQAYNNLGTALQKQNNLENAILNYKKATSLKADFVEAYNNLGNVMYEKKNIEESIFYFQKAITINSDYVEAYNSLGLIYQDLGDKKKAQENFENSIQIKPNHAEAYNNLGNLFNEICEYDDAILNYNKAIKLKPDFEKSYNNLGNLLNSLGRYKEANLAYQEAIRIKPDYALAYSNLLFNLNYYIKFDVNLYAAEAKKFRLNCKTIKENFLLNYKYQKKPSKLNIGFVSSDFGNHPGGYFTLSTLQELKNKNFELIAYSNFDRKDDFVNNFKSLFSKWHSIEKKTDEEVVEQILKDGIHILIELQGHSSRNRLTLFMCKAAPIQISWLSQGTLGIPEIDYLIGSPCITPKKEESNFCEKILRLPDITQCFTPPEFNIKVENLPAIENKFITFGCLNKLSKINEDVIVLWAKILSLIPNSKLLLKSKEFNDKKIVKSTLEKFNKNNIDSDRIIFEGKSNTRKEVLEVYNSIDIALDPFPFQGNTSTCEAIWMGVPVITLKGDRFLFHFGESIISNLKMYDWIANDYKDYINKTINLCANLDKLSIIRKTLRQKALESPVFDAKRFAKNFSNLLWNTWEKKNL